MTAWFFYLLFAGLSCVAVFRPWIGIVGYFAYVVLGADSTGADWFEFPISSQKLLAAGTLLGIVVAQVRWPRLTPNGIRAIVSLTAFLVVALMSAQFSMFQVKSWWFIDYFWKIWLMFLVATILLDRPNRILIAMWAIVLAQGWNALCVNYEYFQVGMSLTSIYGRNSLDNNTYSLSTLLPMTFAAALAIFDRRWFPRLILGLILCLQVHQVLLMSSRGGMLSLIVMFLIGCYFMPKRFDTILGASLVLVASLALAGPMVTKRFGTIFAEEKARDASAESRFALWSAGFKIMCDHPLTGVGVFAGERLVPLYLKLKDEPEKALHNLFFDIGTGTGFPGVAVYLAFFYFAWRCALQTSRIKNPPNWASAAALSPLVGLPTYWFGSMFSSSALIEAPYLACAISVATASVIARANRNMIAKSRKTLSDQQLIGAPAK